MGKERMLDALLSTEAIGVVEIPRVVEVGWEACTDESGLEALEVRILLDTGRGNSGAPGEVALSGARSIWEAVLERLYDSGDTRFPYVSFRILGAQGAEDEGARDTADGGRSA